MTIAANARRNHVRSSVRRPVSVLRVDDRGRLVRHRDRGRERP
ncbi:hypothetical protein ACW23B_21175 [Streptomyces albidoflavus]